MGVYSNCVDMHWTLLSLTHINTQLHTSLHIIAHHSTSFHMSLHIITQQPYRFCNPSCASNAHSVFQNPSLGSTILRRCFTSSSASCAVMRLSLMINAMHSVADLLTPAPQCTSTAVGCVCADETVCVLGGVQMVREGVCCMMTCTHMATSTLQQQLRIRTYTHTHIHQCTHTMSFATCFINAIICWCKKLRNIFSRHVS